MAEFKDNDKLDMTGNWIFNRRINVDANWTFPPGPAVETSKMQIVDAGPGSTAAGNSRENSSIPLIRVWK